MKYLMLGEYHSLHSLVQYHNQRYLWIRMIESAMRWGFFLFCFLIVLFQWLHEVKNNLALCVIEGNRS